MLGFHARRTKDGANGARGSSLLADHLAKISRRHPKQKNCTFIVWSGFDANLVWLVNQCFGHTRD